MVTKNINFTNFLNEVMRRKKDVPSQMSKELGVSHATVWRWISGRGVPRISSCHRLAEYFGVSIDEVLSAIGYIPRIEMQTPTKWPEFREYAQRKYPNELDEEIITMIEDLIKRRRARRYEKKKGNMGG